MVTDIVDVYVRQRLVLCANRLTQPRKSWFSGVTSAVQPVARLELWPEDPKQPDGHDPLIEAQIPAERFRQLGFKVGEKLVVSPKKARVFLRVMILEACNSMWAKQLVI